METSHFQQGILNFGLEINSGDGSIENSEVVIKIR